MAKFNNIIKWIFLIGFSTTLVMQVAGDDESIVESVNNTLALIQKDFEDLGKIINSQTTINPTNIPSSTAKPTDKPSSTTKPTVPSSTAKPTVPSSTAKPTVPSSTAKPTVPSSTAKPTVPSSTAKPTVPSSTAKSTVPSSTAKTTVPSSTAKTIVPSTKHTNSSTTTAAPSRKKRDVLSQIWEMKMRKMQNKLATPAPPVVTAVKKLTDAMANVTAVTDDIAKGTINEDQVTTVNDAQKKIHDVVETASDTLIKYLQSNSAVFDDLQNEAQDASKTVEKYWDDHFEDDSGANVGAIVGGVCGGVAGVGLLGFGYYYYKKKQS